MIRNASTRILKLENRVEELEEKVKKAQENRIKILKKIVLTNRNINNTLELMTELTFNFSKLIKIVSMLQEDFLGRMKLSMAERYEDKTEGKVC